MRFNLEDNKLTLFLEGELNSYNAETIEKEINSTLEGKCFTSLILNFENLRYISSAGLRVVLKLKQKYNDLTIIETSLEIYDTLQMTGFTDIIETKKALKRIYLQGAEIIGEGFFSTVYRIDKDTIIKVFNRTSDSEQIERELKLAKEAFVLGVPTAISFDIVKVDDGKLGVRFEMLDCDSLKNVFLKKEIEYEYYLEKYAELLKKINTTECFDPKIPNIKKFFEEKVEKIKPFLEEKYYLKAKRIIENIEDRQTFVHGDCHFKNIMVQKDELLLIDMDTLSVGHPIFELASIYCPYCAFEEDDKGNCERFLGVKSEFANKLYDDLVNKYFGKNDQIIKDKIKIVAYIHMVWWNRTNEPNNNVRLEGCRDRLYKLLDKYEDANI